MPSALLLGLVVNKRAAVIQLLESKNQALLVRGGAFDVLEHDIDGVKRLKVQMRTL